MAKKEFEIRHGLISGSTLVIDSAGNWVGNTILENKGGTAQTTYVAGDILYASGVDTLTKLTAGSNTDILTLSGGVPTWAAPAGTGSPSDQLHLVGGDGITVTTGSPEVTVAVDNTVFRTTNNLTDIADVNAGSPTLGAVLYNDGTNWLKLARGANGQVLTMGSPLLPSWKFDSFGGSPADNQFVDMKEPTGFVNRTDSRISFNDSNRTFTIELLGSPTNYEYYIKGTKFTETSTKDVVIPNTTGTHYIYFDTTQTLLSTTTWSETLITDLAYICAVYWNATAGSPAGESIYIADERHGITMDGITHVHLHTVLGAQFVSGLGLNGTWNPDASSPVDADVHIDVADGIIRDEDLKHDIVNTGSAVNVYDLEQDLTPIAQIPVLYRLGTGSPTSGGDWNVKPADNFPFIYSDGVTFTGGSSLPAYNEFTGSTWQLTEVTNNRFFLTHILATNDINTPVVAIQGILEYQNKPQGKELAGAELALLSGLPFEEFVPIATLIFEARTSYSNTPQCRGRTTEDDNDYVDWRKVDTFTSTTGLFQNLWSEFTADTGSAIAIAPNDSFAFTGGTGISTSITGDILTISATGSPVGATNVVGGDGITVTTGSPEVTVAVDATVFRTTNTLDDISDVVAGSPTIGAVLYNDGTNWLKLARGTNGQVLTMGSPLLPKWTTGTGQPDQNLWLNMDADSGGPVAANTTTDTFTITGGTSITTSISGDVVTIVNDDPNVDQNLFLNVLSDSGTATADTTTDTLSILGGTGISTAVSADAVTITNDSPNVDQNLWLNIAGDVGGPVAANTTSDTLTIAGGTSISTSISGDTITVNMTGSPLIGDPDQNLWLNMDADSGGPVAANTITDTFTITGGTSITTSISGDVVTIVNDDPNVDQNLWLNMDADSGGPVAANTTSDTFTIAGGTGISTAISGDTITITNDTGGSPVIPSLIIVTDESTDTTCFPLFVTAATGNLQAKTGSNMTFNSATGHFTATSKSFLIDHPTKPGKKLQYGSLEGPELGIYVRGHLRGSRVIELPDYWIELADPDSITVNLTPNSKQQTLYVEKIENNTVYVGGNTPQDIDCFYTIFATRADIDKLVVED